MRLARDSQSNARVKLPTWAVVERTPAGLVSRYTYDDGPGKVVLETDTVTLTSEPPVWNSVEQGKPRTTRLSIQGLASLRNGRGTLVLTGAGTKNGHAVDTRTTLHVTRNLLEITRETRIAGASFEFLDGYTLTRREPPTPWAPARYTTD